MKVQERLTNLMWRVITIIVREDGTEVKEREKICGFSDHEIFGGDRLCCIKRIQKQ